MNERARAFLREFDALVDTQLAGVARLAHPRIHNWWGRRYLGGTNGAWCYLCDAHIATWSRRWPITAQARAKIAVHRRKHMLEHLDAPALKPEE